MVFKFYYYSLKELLYTFWGITLFLATSLIYLFFDALGSEYFLNHATLIFSMLVIHGIIIYIASSPVYYPRVYWWEFEFRYRADFKIFIEHDNVIDEARMTDIRREGAALYSFENFEAETYLKLVFKYLDEAYEFQVVVGSKGRNIPGRPYSYGIKFILADKEDKNNYKRLAQSWSHRNKIQILEKFETKENESC